MFQVTAKLTFLSSGGDIIERTIRLGKDFFLEPLKVVPKHSPGRYHYCENSRIFL